MRAGILFLGASRTEIAGDAGAEGRTIGSSSLSKTGIVTSAVEGGAAGSSTLGNAGIESFSIELSPEV